MSRVAIITYIDGRDDNGEVDNTLPGIPGYPTTGPIYGGGRPDNSLPPAQGGAIQLPVYPFDPTAPDNSLPGPTPPPTVWPPRPGSRWRVKWLACKGLILVPDNSLPETEVPEPK